MKEEANKSQVMWGGGNLQVDWMFSKVIDAKERNNYNRPAVGIFESIWIRMDATATTS